eukprot:m.123393 g.123393  ORF g.123393 m.123393 type:complete len:492 (-) comp14445_c1_seq2:33-1508(-)
MLSAGMVDDSVKGETRAYGGLAAEFYRRVSRFYNNETNSTTACFIGEPKVVEQVFQAWLQQYNISLMTGEVLANVATSTNKITSITTLSGKTFMSNVFVDATYEGDLMAMTGVPYSVGRENSAKFNESFGGQGLCSEMNRTNGYEQFKVFLNASDFLGKFPFWNSEQQGLGDKLIQSFNFRACLTKTEGKYKITQQKPENYNRNDYYLVQQYLLALKAAGRTATSASFFGCNSYHNGKCDTNDGPAVGINPMGNETFDWPTSNHSTRLQLRERFASYTLGLWYFLGNDNLVPTTLKQEMNNYYLCEDEFVSEADHLPHIPYVREGRRMQSDQIFTQSDYLHASALSNNTAIGQGFWFVDCHAVQHVITKDTNNQYVVHNEGCVQYGRDNMDNSYTWSIPYGVVVPPRSGVNNLVVTCAVSATHIGYQPFRVEPTFMVIGEAVGTAATIMIASNTTIQDVNITQLQNVLRKNGQVVSRSDMSPSGTVIPQVC